MVQNYIRYGLLPPPAGRLYSQKHLAALVIIGFMKMVFDMPAIKKNLLPYMDEEGLPLETYRMLMVATEQAQTRWDAHVGLSEALPMMLHVSKLKEKIH
jgi:DNA-binding transcriptional MerR regulator